MFKSFLDRIQKHPFYSLLTIISVLFAVFLGFVTLIELFDHSLYVELFKQNQDREPKTNSLHPTTKTSSNRGDENDTIFKKNVAVDTFKFHKETRYLDTSPDVDSSSYNTFFKVIEIPASNRSSVVQMTEPHPEWGMGKLAISSFCGYCDDNLVKIFLKSSSDSLDDDYEYKYSILPVYDPSRRKKTIYIDELIPGIYDVKLDYGRQGVSILKAEVIEGRTLLYTNEKTNPYGQGNAQIVLVTDNKSPHRWRITIDDTIKIGIVTLRPQQGLFIDIPYECRILRVEKITPNSFSIEPDTILKPLDLRAGERKEIPIN